MKSIRLLLAGIMLISAFISCRKIDSPLDDSGKRPENDTAENIIRIPVSLSCELLEPEMEEIETRSNHDPATLRKITNVNYYLFREGRFVKQEYFDDAEDFSVSLPSPSYKYNLYILANVGPKTISSSLSETEMSTVNQDYGSYQNYFKTIESNGFPMSSIIKDFSSGSGGDYTLKRLVHTLYVKMNTSELSTTSMKFTSLKIKQAPRDVFPFATESKARYTMDGDAANLSTDDMEMLNAGKTVTLYLLENMRGTLLPGNTDWKQKIPSKIASSEERYMSSFIEMTAKAETITATYENNIYRAYVGTGPSDFNAKRSTYFTINNNFTNDMIVDEDWRIEPDTPNVTAKLAFVDTRYTAETATSPASDKDDSNRPFKEVDAFYTMKGFTALYYIYRSDPRIDFDVTMVRTNDYSADCNTYVTYKTSQLDDHFTAIMINTTYPIIIDRTYQSGDPDFTYGKSVTFKVRSKDGVIEDQMICKIIENPLELRFKYEGVSEDTPTQDAGQLNMYFCNPLKLRVQVEVTGSIKGYVSYKPNGTWGSTKSQSPSVATVTGNKYLIYDDGSIPGYGQYVTPESGVASRIDNYHDQGSYAGSKTPIDGFHELFKKLWKHTGWDSYTWLNGSNGYDKHAHPTEMSLNIKLSFDSPNSSRLIPHSFYGDVLQLPVYITNQQLTSTSSGAYYGAGTDMGFIWHHCDKAGSGEWVTYRFLKSTASPGKTYYSGDNQVPINVTINGTNTWKTDKTGIPCQHIYSETSLSHLGFESFK